MEKQTIKIDTTLGKAYEVVNRYEIKDVAEAAAYIKIMCMMHKQDNAEALLKGFKDGYDMAMAKLKALEGTNIFDDIIEDNLKTQSKIKKAMGFLKLAEDEEMELKAYEMVYGTVNSENFCRLDTCETCGKVLYENDEIFFVDAWNRNIEYCSEQCLHADYSEDEYQEMYEDDMAYYTTKAYY